MDKTALRKKYLAERVSIAENDWHARSQKICEHLVEFCLKKTDVRQIFLFHAIRKEVPVHTLAKVLSQHFEIALPRIVGKNMEFRFWDENVPLVKNSYGIDEPSSSAKLMTANENTIVLVPNLAMDKKGYRLGYGAGFYDAFLAKNPEVISIGVNFSQFLVHELPHESWDQKVKHVCTELGVQ